MSETLTQVFLWQHDETGRTQWRADSPGPTWNRVGVPRLCYYDDALAHIEAKDALNERLRLEAQVHAQEARTAKTSLAECYQAVTGASGEPGYWHGAEPIRAALAARDAEIARLRALLLRCRDQVVSVTLRNAIDAAREQT